MTSRELAGRLAPLGAPWGRTDLPRHIDHTFLRPDGTPAGLEVACREARDHGFAALCVSPAFLPRAVALLEGSTTAPIAVVGFPSGTASREDKAAEALAAVRAGAREIDMVADLAALVNGDFRRVLEDIAAVVLAVPDTCVKVILEMGELTLEQKIAGCALARAAGAAYVKTSTGFGRGGATAEDVALMRRVVGDALGVKASGGIRTAEQARQLFAAGADRIGTSASVAIVESYFEDR